MEFTIPNRSALRTPSPAAGARSAPLVLPPVSSRSQPATPPETPTQRSVRWADHIGNKLVDRAPLSHIGKKSRTWVTKQLAAPCSVCAVRSATKQCLACVRFESTGNAQYCDTCFQARHPPYRVPHAWEPLEPPEPLQPPPLVSLERQAVRNSGSIQDLLLQARTMRSKVTPPVKIAPHEYPKANSICKRLDMRARQNMEQLNKGVRHMQARKIQQTWRTHVARKGLRRMAKLTYNKMFDPIRRRYYYIDSRTNAVQWTKPLLLGNEDVYVLPRIRAKDMSRDQAARFIQNMVRTHFARKRLRGMVRAQYKKAVDPDTGKTYYYNVVTGVVTWDKPKFLGNEDLTPRPERRRIKRAKNMTPDEAASYLQKLYKARKVRKHIRAMVRAQWRKAQDPSTGKVYYFNVRTKQVSWEKPKLLGSEDLTPRPEARRGSLKACHMSRDSAAKKLQRMFRARNARKRIKALVRGLFRKAVDPNSGKSYYYNIRTGEVSWEKPKLLGNDSFTPRPMTPKAIVKADDLTPDQAARKIVGLFRRVRARKTIKNLIRSVYQKVYDSTTGTYFYFNLHTQESSWEKPKLLGSSDIGKTPRGLVSARARVPGSARPGARPRVTAASLSEDDAARKIVGLFRRTRARNLIKSLLRNLWQKVYDADSGTWYYFNTATQESSWTKPRLLGKSDLEKTPRHLARRARPPRVGADGLSEDAAVRKIVGMFRRARARDMIKALLRSLWMKVYDADSGTWYYFNTATQESSWEKPKLLGNSDLEKTPRHLSRRARPPRVKAAGMTMDDAATKLQGMWRRRQGRKLLRDMCKRIWTKVYDKSSGVVYYYNTITHESKWTKPALLGAADDVGYFGVDS